MLVPDGNGAAALVVVAGGNDAAVLVVFEEDGLSSIGFVDDACAGQGVVSAVESCKVTKVPGSSFLKI